jgi:hypothetical protein
MALNPETAWQNTDAESVACVSPDPNHPSYVDPPPSYTFPPPLPSLRILLRALSAFTLAFLGF